MVGNGAIVLQKSLSGLLRGKTSNHHGDFYCLNCNHSYSTENRLNKHEKICNILNMKKYAIKAIAVV